VILPIPGVRGAHAYLVEGPDGLAVVDPGYTGSYRAVLRFLAQRGYETADLHWVILTHHHVDHGGTALALCQQTNARLAVHRADQRYLVRGRPRERATLFGVFELVPEAIGRFVMSCAGCETRPLEDGDVIAGLRVIHAPGHTPGSICLYSEQESALLTGDVLNNERGVRTPPWTVNHDHARARRAALRLLGLRFERAYFGHGPPLEEGASARVDAFLARLIPAPRPA
jgi:glyoxylase-like metal-dependent hydrolase (beta-lactamase superfamily II)